MLRYMSEVNNCPKMQSCAALLFETRKVGLGAVGAAPPGPVAPEVGRGILEFDLPCGICHYVNSRDVAVASRVPSGRSFRPIVLFSRHCQNVTKCASSAVIIGSVVCDRVIVVISVRAIVIRVCECHT